jgi:hypothetical protein
LELVIANKNWPESNLPLSTDSQFVISFEMGDTAKEGAVATEAQVKGISIKTTSQSEWNVPSMMVRTEWPVTPKSGTTQLAYDDRIKLEITNLVTSHSSGSGYLYVRYSNIPNYPDGQFVVAIEKTPLLYRGAQVGIGTNNPLAEAPCEWWGCYARTGESCTLEIGISNDANDHIALMPGGNVGIGINDPSAKLHVSGNAKVTGNAEVNGNLGIGTTSTSEKLHVDGNAKVSGKLAIRTTTPTTIDLAIGDNDTGLKQEAENKLAIYTDNAERVRIDEQWQRRYRDITADTPIAYSR